MALPRLIRLFKTLNPTIDAELALSCRLLSTLAVKFSGLPILVWNVRCSDMDLKRYPPLTRWVQRVLAQSVRYAAAVVIVNSEVGSKNMNGCRVSGLGDGRSFP